jgi:hypothetical protein
MKQIKQSIIGSAIRKITSTIITICLSIAMVFGSAWLAVKAVQIVIGLF